jgi:predicted nuclease of predicted toxin-antitoxin system
MRVVLDENLPIKIRQFFDASFQVVTVQELGFSGIKNGELLAELEGNYEVFLTADKNLLYQQNLTGRSLSIVELPINRWPILKLHDPEIVAATATAIPGGYIQLTF